MDTCTAYTAAVTLYGNGQRSGVITNLRISEFDLRQEEDENLVVIPCVHHKTGAQAMAQLAITTDIEDILIYYFNTYTCSKTTSYSYIKLNLHVQIRN